MSDNIEELKPYLQHKFDCDSLKPYSGCPISCTCGLDALLAEKPEGIILHAPEEEDIPNMKLFAKLTVSKPKCEDCPDSIVVGGICGTGNEPPCPYGTGQKEGEFTKDFELLIMFLQSEGYGKPVETVRNLAKRVGGLIDRLRAENKILADGIETVNTTCVKKTRKLQADLAVANEKIEKYETFIKLEIDHVEAFLPLDDIAQATNSKGFILRCKEIVEKKDE